MRATRVVSTTVDFARIYSKLGLGKETVAAVQAFRKRNSEAQRINAQLKSQQTIVDIEHYRGILKNQSVVDEADKILKEFKPITYDVTSQLKAIDTFEAKAASSAAETSKKIDEELKELQSTLSNIEQARPFEDLTADEVGEAHPEIRKAVETMISKGKWTVPGYKEKFGDLTLM